MLRMIFAAVSVLIATSTVGMAATPKKIGTFDNWTVWSYTQKKRKHCFIYANPVSERPTKLRHGLVSFFIRSTKRADVRSEASLQVGYPFAAGSDARLEVDGRRFRMRTSADGAWLARPGVREREVLQALRGGRSMTITATSARGNRTRYVFPLKGVTQAMRRLRSVCP